MKNTISVFGIIIAAFSYFTAVASAEDENISEMKKLAEAVVSHEFPSPTHGEGLMWTGHRSPCLRLYAVDRNDETLQEKLKKPSSISLDENNTFADLFEILKTEHDIQAIVDPGGAGALGITASSPIVREPFSLENVPLRRILRQILSEQDLTFVIDEGFLLITSDEEAQRRMKVKVYDVADLIRNPDAGKPIQYITTELPRGGGWSGGSMPIYAEMIDGRKGTVTRVIRETEYDFSDLMDLIECVIVPETWSEGAEMMESYTTGSLVIRQTDEIHEEIEQLLNDLRQNLVQRKPQPKKSVVPPKPRKRFLRK